MAKADLQALLSQLGQNSDVEIVMPRRPRPVPFKKARVEALEAPRVETTPQEARSWLERLNRVAQAERSGEAGFRSLGIGEMLAWSDQRAAPDDPQAPAPLLTDGPQDDHVDQVSVPPLEAAWTGPAMIEDQTAPEDAQAQPPSPDLPERSREAARPPSAVRSPAAQAPAKHALHEPSGMLPGVAADKASMSVAPPLVRGPEGARIRAPDDEAPVATTRVGPENHTRAPGGLSETVTLVPPDPARPALAVSSVVFLNEETSSGAAVPSTAPLGDIETALKRRVEADWTVTAPEDDIQDKPLSGAPRHGEEVRGVVSDEPGETPPVSETVAKADLQALLSQLGQNSDVEIVMPRRPRPVPFKKARVEALEAPRVETTPQEARSWLERLNRVAQAERSGEAGFRSLGIGEMLAWSDQRAAPDDPQAPAPLLTDGPPGSLGPSEPGGLQSNESLQDSRSDTPGSAAVSRNQSAAEQAPHTPTVSGSSDFTRILPATEALPNPMRDTSSGELWTADRPAPRLVGQTLGQQTEFRSSTGADSAWRPAETARRRVTARPVQPGEPRTAKKNENGSPETPEGSARASLTRAVSQKDAREELPFSVRDGLASLLGADLPDVDLQRDATAAQAVWDAGAEALFVPRSTVSPDDPGATVERDTVLLAPGHDLRGARTLGLLAHELTHVALRRDPGFIPTVIRDGAFGAPLEEEALAQQVEHRVRAHLSVRPHNGAASQRVRDGFAVPLSGTPAAPVHVDIRTVHPPENTGGSVWQGLPAPWEPLPYWEADAPALPISGASAGRQVISGLSASAPAATLPGRVFTPPAAPSSLPTGVQAAPLDRRTALAESPRGAAVERARQPATPDLDQLARQVYMLLKRRLAAEVRRLG
ncbi:eCIS core domain-containing protein [Deinococcus peraridilitoris]|uniref:eCIS core domain-containing protein n=1 Tax=Deinococcus peraridilitoris TaxID=432329 RepID=UPI00059C9BE6|nr:DUF4157 domain-containing protein [Deinococcus peraridilitoris]